MEAKSLPLTLDILNRLFDRGLERIEGGEKVRPIVEVHGVPAPAQPISEPHSETRRERRKFQVPPFGNLGELFGVTLK